ncbi:hypothetical protein E3N88_15652 [Mikania micrantha]|uniref:Uncharacterized protein n=1 Tax=Mikania micrantha TaxID=192012 RepID=A0A5N6NWL3_9ASTR|nr:hypothetical protein E3N88_15652 [Mikania micrantha]
MTCLGQGLMVSRLSWVADQPKRWGLSLFGGVKLGQLLLLVAFDRVTKDAGKKAGRSADWRLLCWITVDYLSAAGSCTAAGLGCLVEGYPTAAARRGGGWLEAARLRVSRWVRGKFHRENKELGRVDGRRLCAGRWTDDDLHIIVLVLMDVTLYHVVW